MAAAAVSAAPLHAAARQETEADQAKTKVEADPDAMCFVSAAVVTMAMDKEKDAKPAERQRQQLLRLALPYFAARLDQRLDDDALTAKLAEAREAFKQVDREKVTVDCFDAYKAGMKRVANALKSGAAE